MSANITTLYLGNTNMRLMVTRGKRIIKLADMPLDTSLGDIDNAEKEAQLVDKVKYLFTSNKIGTRKIVLGISGLHCLTRPFSLPELPKAMLEEAVLREARRVLPVPVEQLYISWHTVAVSADKVQAFMVAIPRPIADIVLRIVNRAGFKPYLMDIKPLALARLAREASAIIVDVQPSEFDIVIMVNGIPQPIRTLPFPIEALSLKERLLIVKDELARTIQFHNSSNQENKIQPDATILVSGEIADEPEMYDSLGLELGYKVTPLTSPLKCLKQLDPSHHLVNVGLALKELTQEAGPLLPNLNTLPAPYQPKQISTNRLLAIPATAAAIGLIILLGMTVRDAAANLDTAKIDLSSTNLLLEKKQAQKKEMTASVAAMEQKLAGIESARKSYTAALNSLTQTGIIMNDDLRATVNNVVDDLDIAALSYSRGGVSITGQASSEQEVMQYVRKLTSTGRFSEITIANLNRTVDTSENDSTSMDYSLNLKLLERKK